MEGSSVSGPLVHPTPFPLPSPQRVMSPSRLSKLPPIAGSTEEPAVHHLHIAKSEVNNSMHHLLEEAQSAETRMQSAIDTLWERMLGILESKEKEYKRQLSKEQEELSLAKAQLQKLTEREAALTHQNAKLSVDLVAADKQYQSQQSELAKIKTELQCKGAELNSFREQSKSKLDKSSTEADTLRKASTEQAKIIKEYHEKVSKMTEKIQKLSKDLTVEKESAQQLQKSTSSLMNQKTTENKKMALEISKLKAQLATTSSTMSANREEIKKLEMQLKNANSEATVSSLHMQHAGLVKTLESKISQLKEELARQQDSHEREIYALNEKLQNALRATSGEDDYMLARIKFLQHQNQQEKVKLAQDKGKPK